MDAPKPAFLRNRRRRGFMLLDVMTGFFLLTAIGTALVVVQSARHRTAARFADTRSAIHLAERALSELQGRGPMPKALDDARVEIHPLPGDAPIPGMKWIQIRAIVHGQSASLCGLVPAAALTDGVQP